MEFTVEETFNVSAEKLYNAWLDPDEHSDMTGGEALITEDVDDKFTAWDGYIWGTNLEFQKNEYIKQTWMTSDFEEDQDYSTVEIFFKEIEDGTKVIIKHSNLNENDDHYKQGWIDNYFVPMKKYFKE